MGAKEVRKQPQQMVQKVFGRGMKTWTRNNEKVEEEKRGTATLIKRVLKDVQIQRHIEE